uniref:Uncharacterized protein n=1 Tax=Anguilla anguilla TaxID=7936 RepID=A0A0E9PKI2_ANGAN
METPREHMAKDSVITQLSPAPREREREQERAQMHRPSKGEVSKPCRCCN